MANMAFDICTAVSLRNIPEQNLPDCDNTTVNNDHISPEATPQVRGNLCIPIFLFLVFVILIAYEN